MPTTRAHLTNAPAPGLQLLTLPDAARRLAIAPRTVRAWVQDGRLPVVRLSKRCHRVRLSTLEQFVASREGA